MLLVDASALEENEFVILLLCKKWCSPKFGAADDDAIIVLVKSVLSFHIHLS